MGNDSMETLRRQQSSSMLMQVTVNIDGDKDKGDIAYMPKGQYYKKINTAKSYTRWLLYKQILQLSNVIRSIRRGSRSLAFHIFTTFLLFAFLSANINYVTFKLQIYYRELPSVLEQPWLLVIVLCECIYLLCAFISAVDYAVPPTLSGTGKRATSLQGGILRQFAARVNGDASGFYADVEKQSDGGALPSSAYPTVDVMIPCCKEPTEVPQETILAALSLQYPKDRYKVFVLDDGGDDALKAFCESLQSKTDRVTYLRRQKIPGVPHNFKCGNMNYGLRHSDAEYIVMMDADMVLHPTFLERLLPHMLNSPDVAFVQIPQAFYNLPLGDPLNDACGFTYDRVMVHRNTLSCASCLGTGVIFRRQHLESIGGFQPQSITEDTMTAYVLFNKGYKSVYVCEKLQTGLVPWTFEGFVKQRQRWGQGAIQQLAATWRAMLGPRSKLNFLQKVCYFWHTGYYYMSVLNVVLAITLWAALAFRLNLIVGTEQENRELIASLALYLIVWKIFWYVIWIEVPQPMQSRNRDESQFWWMTPFFFKMVMESAFFFERTFKFVPTSNIDRAAAASATRQRRCFLISTQKLQELKHVRVHITFILVSLATVAVRSYAIVAKYGIQDCGESFLVIGLSVFLLTVSAHMAVPVLHILFPTGFKPGQRKSLLKYDSNDVPVFDPKDCVPKWHWSVWFYEGLSYATFAYWIAVLWAVKSGFYSRWCDGSFSH